MSQSNHRNNGNSHFLSQEGSYTNKEIAGQPTLWRKTWAGLLQQQADVKEFLDPILKLPGLRVILTGAGSSAFIGESLQCLLLPFIKTWTQAIPTTDLVSNPDCYYLPEVPTLLVSFARSGNSPESLAAVNLGNKFCPNIFHLVITCNAEGQLAYFAKGDSNAFTLILPEEANDKSLAMTGSFTSMYLAGYSVFSLNNQPFVKKCLDQAVENAIFILEEFKKVVDLLKEKDFKRVVFLGSGSCLGIARECHLKLQELTDGQLICKHDSFLGFRHGPKVVINEKALVVFLFSNEEQVFRYEKDLADSILEDPREILSLSIGKTLGNHHENHFDFPLPNNDPQNVLYPLAQTLIGQVLGYHFSLHLGLSPDNPSVNGVISRVVEGVTIYDFE